MSGSCGASVRSGSPSHGRHPLLPLLLAASIAACSSPAGRPATIVETGRIASPQIVEASGLARSSLVDDRFWLLNDAGSPPVLHAIGVDGGHHGSVTLDPAANVDWEAISSFELDGKAWLLVADAGDNEALRDSSTIYILEEPDLASSTEIVRAPDRTIRFRWPDGPRDCEAVAVDAAGERILLLSKRTIPAVLYELPLRPEGSGIVTAARLGEVDALPQPDAEDIARAPREFDWHWQPTAMDVARDGGAAVILTYRAVYHFARATNQPWIEALSRPPVAIELGGIREAEAVALLEDGSTLVTVEGSHAPLYRIGTQ